MTTPSEPTAEQITDAQHMEVAGILACIYVDSASTIEKATPPLRVAPIRQQLRTLVQARDAALSRAEQAEKDAAYWKRDVEGQTAAHNGFYQALRRSLEPLFPEGSRDLDHDVMPGCVAGALRNAIAAKEQAEKERDEARREAEGAKKFLDDLHFVLRAKEGGELFLYDNDGSNFGVRYIDTNSTDAAKCKHRILTFDLPHAAACMRQWLEQDAARAATDALARRVAKEQTDAE